MNWIKFDWDDQSTWPPIYDEDHKGWDKYFLAILRQKYDYSDNEPFVSYRAKGNRAPHGEFINVHDWQFTELTDLEYWQPLPKPPEEDK